MKKGMIGKILSRTLLIAVVLTAICGTAAPVMAEGDIPAAVTHTVTFVMKGHGTAPADQEVADGGMV